MRKIYHTILTVARTASPVIIYGETGTGKELAARAIHQSSDRCTKTLIAVNCASLSENLLESELFGHVKGAFTGAIRDKNGLLREARDSTVLLDEISEVSPLVQARLLRFLQNGEVRPVGSSAVQTSNARVVATTNVRLEDRVAEGKFREDLFHRLNVISLVLPPLRERREDIPLLSHCFLKEFAEEQKKPVRAISPAALSLLMAQDWPGNVRELRNALERAVTFCTGDSVLPFHIYPSLKVSSGEKAAPALLDLGRTIAATERAQIVKALQISGGNKSKAAEILGIDRITLWRKIKTYRLTEHL
jgi:transcriptional regulator with PAS, ATPase and Fis domain